MSKSKVRPERALDDDGYWRRLGEESGRVNAPRTAHGDAPARSALIAAWRNELTRVRQLAIDELTAIDSGRSGAKLELDEFRRKAATDPRMAAALPTVMEKDLKFALRRANLVERFSGQLDQITQRANECDALWRAANEGHRDRRLALDATVFDVPGDLRSLPVDPHA